MTLTKIFFVKLQPNPAQPNLGWLTLFCQSCPSTFKENGMPPIHSQEGLAFPRDVPELTRLTWLWQ